MTDWQPIETAPKNGSLVLLFLDPPLNTNDTVGWCPARVVPVVVGWWEDGYDAGWHCGFCEEGTADSYGYSSSFNMTVSPTHWMPLPEPPKV